MQQELTQRWWQSVHVQLPPWLKALGAPVLVAIAYYLGAQVAFIIGTLSDRIFAPFWPPNIILFCALVLAPKRRWWLYIAAAFPAHFIAESTVGMPAVQCLVAFVTNCMVAILSACGVRRFLREPPWFGTLRNAAIYVLITAGAGPAISALGGAFVQILGGGPIANYWRYWWSWGIPNALGSVTLGPIFLIWFSPRPESRHFMPRRKAESIILAVTLVATCAVAFHVSAGTITSGFVPALLYSPLPLILWAAIRFGGRGASGAILVVTMVSISENLRASTLFNSVDAGSSVLALQIFLLGVAIPVFLLGAAIDELRQSGEAMRRLAGALLSAQDEERRRIARELHDSTGQNLILANLMAERVQSLALPAGRPVIAELKGILHVAVNEIRTLSYLLHPPLLDAGGLNMALRPYIEGFSKRTAIRVELELSPKLGRLPQDVELVLFRVTQEALTNIWRHSGSRTARIRLMRLVSNGGSQITLTIEDDGKGIPDNIRLSTLSGGKNTVQAPSGLGLAGMRERLHQIGGQLEIDSEAGKTVIRASVRVNPETERDSGPGVQS
jgi:signal transduction histidine kinase